MQLVEVLDNVLQRQTHYLIIGLELGLHCEGISIPRLAYIVPTPILLDGQVFEEDTEHVYQVVIDLLELLVELSEIPIGQLPNILLQLIDSAPHCECLVFDDVDDLLDDHVLILGVLDGHLLDVLVDVANLEELLLAVLFLSDADVGIQQAQRVKPALQILYFERLHVYLQLFHFRVQYSLKRLQSSVFPLGKVPFLCLEHYRCYLRKITATFISHLTSSAYCLFFLSLEEHISILLSTLSDATGESSRSMELMEVFFF